ncbi:MAG: hypothetical protein EA350_09425 [Gemmatimonadales bacterium]|nr:MAG: hypothetical protein EA350_09425 [Gemmatimonadales bacterium]
MPDDAVALPLTPTQLRYHCLRELVHALNGRASVARGLAELAAAGHRRDAGALDLGPPLADEAEALEVLARHLQLVVPPATESAELLDPVDLLDDALELLGCVGESWQLVSGHRGDHALGEEAGCKPVPPVRMKASDLRGILLVAAEQAQRTLLRQGGAGLGSVSAAGPGVLLLRMDPGAEPVLEVRPPGDAPPLRIPLPPLPATAPGGDHPAG